MPINRDDQTFVSVGNEENLDSNQPINGRETPCNSNTSFFSICPVGYAPCFLIVVPIFSIAEKVFRTQSYDFSQFEKSTYKKL